MNRLKKNWIPVVLVLTLAVSSHFLLQAQAPGQEIRGRVVNDEGQALPQASVLLVNESVNFRRETTPDAQGHFQFSELVEGIYRLEASAEGYLSQTREQLQLPVAVPLEIDFRLQAERTTLREAAERGVGQRNPNIFVRMVGLSGLRDPLRRQGIEPVVLHFDAAVNSHGVDVSAPLRQIHFVRSQDINNSYHGSLYASHQNSALNARPFFNVGPLRSSKRNRFGLNLGGPLLTDRVSFYTSLDFVRESGFVNGNVRVPLPDERTPSNPDPETAEIVATLLQAYPDEEPNLGGRRLNTNAVRRIRSGDWNFRLDYRVSLKDRLAFQYSLFDYDEDPFELVIGQNPRTDVRPQSFGASHTHIWSPQTLMQSSFQFDRVKAILVPTERFQEIVEPLGVEGPAIGFGGKFADLSPVGPDKQFPRKRVQNRFSGNLDLSHQRGHHQIRWGGRTTRVQVNDLQSNDLRGTFLFGSGNPDENLERSDCLDPTSCTTVENFLFGTANKFTIALGDLYRGFRNWEQALYLQDTFQIRRGLTLSLGLRYQIITAPKEVNNRIPFFYETDFNDFGPQVALAWAPREGRTVIRAGYGIAYGHIFPDIYQRIRYNAPAVRVIPIQAPDITDPLKDVDDLEDVATEVTRLSSDLSSQYSHQYNLLIQNRLPGNLLFEIGYVGNRTKGPFYPFVSNRAEPLPNPDDNTTDNVQERRPDPSVARILTVANAGTFYYDALQVGLTRTLTSDLAFNIKYIFSKSLNSASNFIGTANREAGFMGDQNGKNVFGDMKGPSAFDHRHILTLNYSYDLPFRPSHGALAALLGNWTVSGMTAFRSGMWFTVRTSSDGPKFGNVDGRGADRVNILNPDLLGATIDHPDTSTSILAPENQELFDTDIEPGGLGDIPRMAFRADPVNNTNLALTKSFTFSAKEQILQFRAEFQNFLNHPLFAPPGDVFPSDVFGKIVDTQNKGRVMQFTLRWSF